MFKNFITKEFPSILTPDFDSFPASAWECISINTISCTQDQHSQTGTWERGQV